MRKTLDDPEDSDYLKVGVTELQEQLVISEEAGTSIKQVVQQAMNEKGQKIGIFHARRRRGMHCQLGQMERAVKRSGGVGSQASEKEAGSDIFE